MISIKNHKIEKIVDEILKRTHYASPTEYLEDRIKRDHALVIKGKKIH